MESLGDAFRNWAEAKKSVKTWNTGIGLFTSLRKPWRKGPLEQWDSMSITHSPINANRLFGAKMSLHKISDLVQVFQQMVGRMRFSYSRC